MGFRYSGTKIKGEAELVFATFGLAFAELTKS
jgi:hypothetical protein